MKTLNPLNPKIQGLGPLDSDLLGCLDLLGPFWGLRGEGRVRGSAWAQESRGNSKSRRRSVSSFRSEGLQIFRFNPVPGSSARNAACICPTC